MMVKDLKLAQAAAQSGGRKYANGSRSLPALQPFRR